MCLAFEAMMWSYILLLRKACLKGVAVSSVVFVLCRGKGSKWLICKQDSSKVGPKSDENGVQEGLWTSIWASVGPVWPPVPPGSISLGDFPKLFVSTGTHKSIIIVDDF
jgi:hypothetical protein